MSYLRSPKRKAIRLILQILVIVLIVATTFIVNAGNSPVSEKSQPTFNIITQ